MPRHAKEEEARVIRYTQDVVDDKFDDGKMLSDTLKDLQNKRCDVYQIPKITVVKKDDILFSLDNRRLWVYKEYARILEENENVVFKVPVKFGSSEKLKTRGMKTTTEGEDVKVRQSGSTTVFTNINTVWLSAVRFSTDKLCRFSRSGGSQPSTIEEELERFSLKYREPNQLPLLKVVKRKGKLFALDNRQLWMFKKWFENKSGREQQKEKLQSANADTEESIEGPKNELGVERQELEGAVASTCETNSSEIEGKLTDKNDEESKKKSSSAEFKNDVKIQVEFRPYDEFPENTIIENDGLSVQLVEEEEKRVKSTQKFKPLTRQGEGTDRKSAMKYAECYRKQPLQTIKKKYLAFVSGLEIGSKEEQQFALQMFVDMVTGQLGDPGQQAGTANIVGVVIAGYSLSNDTQIKDTLTKAKYLTKKTVAGSVDAIKYLDDSLVQLAGSTEVILMPGEYDPTNFTLPQQSLHKCMFPQAPRYPTLHCGTNPYSGAIDGVKILGTSGQPVNDIYKYSELNDGLEILDKILEWGHLAPTAPDTLDCYPYCDVDPFILTECPHILFSGNQSKFQHKIHKGTGEQRVLILTVPKFCETGTMAIVNLKTLQAYPMLFKSEMEEESMDSQRLLINNTIN